MIAAVLRRLQPNTHQGPASLAASVMPSQAWVSASYVLMAVGMGVLLGLFSVGVTYVSGKWAPLFTLAVFILCFLMIVQQARRLLLFFLICDIPLQLDTNLFYREEAASLGAVGGVTVALTTLLLVGLYGLWIVQTAVKPSAARWRWWILPVPLATYVGFSLLTLATAYDRTLVLFQFALHFQMLLLYVYIVGTVHTKEDIEFIIAVLMFALLMESIIIIALRFIGTTIRVSGLTFLVYGSRVAGTVGSPNSAGAYLSLVLGPAIVVAFTPLGRGYKWLAGAAAVLGTLALVFTLSRGAWIAFALSTGLIVVMAGRRGWLSFKRLMLLFVVAILVASLMNVVILPRVLGSDEGAASTRLPLMEVAFHIIRDHPFFGVGANNVAIVTPRYFTPEYGEAWVYAVHNTYLRIWAEIGPIGLLVYLWFLALTLRWGWRAYKRGDALLAPLALGFTAAILGHMAHMMFDTFHSRPNVQSLWLDAAMIGALYLISTNTPATAGSDIAES